MKVVCLAAALLLSSLLVVFVDGFHCHRPKNLRLVASPHSSLNIISNEQQRINNHNNNHVRSVIMTSLAAATVTTATADYATNTMQELHEETVMVKAKALRKKKTKNEPSLYDILKVSNKATNQELKQAYVQLARKTHPDAAASPAKSSAEEFSNIAQAYNVLSNKKERLRYDRTLLAKAIQQTLEDHLMELISMAVPMLNTFLTKYFIPFLQHVFKVLSLAWQTLQENTNDNTSILQPLEIGSAQLQQEEESLSSSSSMEEAKSVFVTLLKGTVSKAKHFLFKGFQNVEKIFQAIFDDNTMVII